MNKQKNGSAPVYARISVNGERIEMSLRKSVNITDWNSVKGLAKTKDCRTENIDNYLEQTRGMLSGIYQELILTSELITPNLIKNRFLGVAEHRHTLNSLMDYHNLHMIEVLASGTMKNYYTTEKYLKEFIAKQFKKEDLCFMELNYKFITHFEYFLRKHQPADPEKVLYGDLPTKISMPSILHRNT